MAIPRHIGIIMDGNGRWSKKRGLPRIVGHRSGVKTVDKIAKACAEREIKALTLYSFSTENWNRPEEEVNALMSLLEKSMTEYAGKLTSNNIKFNTIGQKDVLPKSLTRAIEELKERTASNSGMVLTLALSYGGREEIISAFKTAIERGEDISSWKEIDIERYLYTNDLPELDLLIRTSGEIRTSNFLLWQAAYSELYFTDTLWPDFNERDLEKALDEFDKRERRFGE